MRWSYINVTPMPSHQAKSIHRSRGYMQPHCAWMTTRTGAIEHGHHWEGAGKNEGPREHEDQCATGASRHVGDAAGAIQDYVPDLGLPELVAAILVLGLAGLEV